MCPAETATAPATSEIASGVLATRSNWGQNRATIRCLATAVLGSQA